MNSSFATVKLTLGDRGYVNFVSSFISYRRLIINFILTVYRSYANLNDVNQAIWSKILTIKRKQLFLVLAASVAIAVIALFLDRNTNLRFEAEVVVNTPSGPKSGSGVYNMRYKYAPLDHWLFPHFTDGRSSTVSGEAISVEVLPGKFLFVLMRSDRYFNEPGRWLYKAFSPPAFQGDINSLGVPGWIRAVKRSSGSYSLPKGEWPQFFAFDDMTNPGSIFAVDPSDLSRSFGPGISVASFNLKSINRPVIFGQVEGLLPWLTDVVERPLCPAGSRSSIAACRLAVFGDFLRRKN